MYKACEAGRHPNRSRLGKSDDDYLSGFVSRSSDGASSLHCTALEIAWPAASFSHPEHNAVPSILHFLGATSVIRCLCLRRAVIIALLRSFGRQRAVRPCVPGPMAPAASKNISVSYATSGTTIGDGAVCTRDSLRSCRDTDVVPTGDVFEQRP